jgi:hypothetical protein
VILQRPEKDADGLLGISIGELGIMTNGGSAHCLSGEEGTEWEGEGAAGQHLSARVEAESTFGMEKEGTGLLCRRERALLGLRKGLAVQKGEGTAGPEERACCAEGRGHCWA